MTVVEQYQAVVAEKKSLGDKLRETLEENKDLQQQINELTRSNETLRGINSRIFKSLASYKRQAQELKMQLEGTKERLDKVIADRNELQADRDFWVHDSTEKTVEIQSLKTDLDDAKKQLEVEKEENTSLHNVIDSFVDKCKELEAKVKGYEDALKDGKERLDKSIADRKELLAVIEKLKNDLKKSNSDRDAYHGLYTELRKDYDRLFEEVRALKVPGCPSLEELRKDLDNAKIQLKSFTQSRDEWRDRAKHAEKELDEIKQEFKQSYADGYSDGNEEGQNELWEMLQMVNDMQPNEFDTECKCIGDVIGMDLEDFKEAYGKWEAEQKKAAEEAKKKRVEYMREYLKRYCIGRLCINCPLYDAFKPVSSCLFSKLTDEEIEKRYRKVIENERKVRATDDPCSGVREKVKEACDAFAEGLKAGLASEVKEVPVSCDIPIKDLASWECTIEATVEVNKDLLEKVCGVKPKEEEHKLEYGDAVRLPWCNYDYMYIAPDEKEETLVRLFDPNIHAIVTTHISNVRYNGGRILVSEEDDIRKIWKYMK